MKTITTFLLLLEISVVSIHGQQPTPERTIDSILPEPAEIRRILDARCVVCHGAVYDGQKEAHGDLDLSSTDSMRATANITNLLQKLREHEMPDKGKLSRRLQARVDLEGSVQRIKAEFDKDGDRERLLVWLERGGGEQAPLSPVPLPAPPANQSGELATLRASVVPRLSETDKAAYDYVRGQPNELKFLRDKAKLRQKRKFVSDEEVIDAVMRDYFGNSLGPETRYLSLVNLYNAEASEPELRAARDAAAKLLNSLSWNPKVSRPTDLPVGEGQGLLLRVDLAAYSAKGYEFDRVQWELVENAYPYGRQHGDRAIAVTGQQRSLSTLLKQTGVRIPFLRADWFAFEASRPPLYHQLLRLPGSRQGLEQLLGIDVTANIRDHTAARAGTGNSGISAQNRLVEYHPIRSYTGNYWLSYDFLPVTDADGTKHKERDLFDHPLGPRNAGLSKKFAFEQAGGEIIFTLPNGLQGYMLVKGDGQRLDVAPTAIVADTSFSRDASIVNGVSCMSCHTLGAQPISDTVRVYYDVARADLPFSDAEQQAIEALYRGADVTARLEEERSRYTNALKNLYLADDEEPVSRVARKFDRRIFLANGPSELGLSVERFQELVRNADLSSELRQIQRLFIKGLGRGEFIASLATLRLNPPFIHTSSADDTILVSPSQTPGDKESLRREALATDAAGVSRISREAASNNVELVRAYLDAGVPCDTKNEGGATPLHWASGREVAEILLAKGAGVNAMDKIHRTPLHWAAGFNHPDVAEVLISNGASVMSVDEHQSTALHWAAYSDSTKVAELLVTRGVPLDAQDEFGNTPLHVAAVHNAKGVAELLLAKSADHDTGNAIGYTPLHLAAGFNAIEVAELLLAKGANPNARDLIGGTPLHIAAFSNSISVATSLLAKRVDVNAKDNVAATPLHWAAMANAKGTANLLITYRADLGAKNLDGDTPLHVAANRDAKDVTELLLSNGVSIKARDKLGLSPLHIAAKGGGLKAAMLLLAKGADPNAQDNDGNTPLHLAAFNRQTEIVRLLLNWKAKPNVRAVKGSTPLDICRDDQSQSLLRTAGARHNWELDN